MSEDSSLRTVRNEDALAQIPQTPPRISIRDLCSLFCCPPFPSSIVSKLAFMPPESSYRIVASNDNRQVFSYYSKNMEFTLSTSLELIDGRAEWPHGSGCRI